MYIFLNNYLVIKDIEKIFRIILLKNLNQRKIIMSFYVFILYFIYKRSRS